jgi:hypothetical protein
MDKRLLETIRGIRSGEIQLKQVNPPHVQNLLTGLCEDLGMNPKLGMLTVYSFYLVMLIMSIQDCVLDWEKLSGGMPGD